jgi:hypothetical protein
MEESSTDRILGILFNENEITWQSIIYELVRSEEMDPWDINLSELSKSYIQALKKLQSFDVKISGKVVLAANLYYSGNTIIIDHGLGMYSYFGHLSAFSVHEGDEVIQDQVVGKVGATGLVTGPHLHWSVRLVGTRVDPLSLLSLLGK